MRMSPLGMALPQHADLPAGIALPWKVSEEREYIHLQEAPALHPKNAVAAAARTSDRMLVV